MGFSWNRRATKVGAAWCSDDFWGSGCSNRSTLLFGGGNSQKELNLKVPCSFTFQYYLNMEGFLHSGPLFLG